MVDVDVRDENFATANVDLPLSRYTAFGEDGRCSKFSRTTALLPATVRNELASMNSIRRKFIGAA
jgi:hypothetical protein